MPNAKDVLGWMEQQEQIKHEQTNEEWLRKAKTYEIARFLAKELLGYHYLASVHGIKKQEQQNNLISWLKKEHKDDTW